MILALIAVATWDFLPGPMQLSDEGSVPDDVQAVLRRDRFAACSFGGVNVALDGDADGWIVTTKKRCGSGDEWPVWVLLERDGKWSVVLSTVAESVTVGVRGQRGVRNLATSVFTPMIEETEEKLWKFDGQRYRLAKTTRSRTSKPNCDRDPSVCVPPAAAEDEARDATAALPAVEPTQVTTEPVPTSEDAPVDLSNLLVRVALSAIFAMAVGAWAARRVLAWVKAIGRVRYVVFAASYLLLTFVLYYGALIGGFWLVPVGGSDDLGAGFVLVAASNDVLVFGAGGHLLWMLVRRAADRS